MYCHHGTCAQRHALFLAPAPLLACHTSLLRRSSRGCCMLRCAVVVRQALERCSPGTLLSWRHRPVHHGFGGGEDVADDEDEGGSSDDEPTFKGERVQQGMLVVLESSTLSLTHMGSTSLPSMDEPLETWEQCSRVLCTAVSATSQSVTAT